MPRPYIIPVSFRHHTRYLGNMRKIMNDPRRQQFSCFDTAKCRMKTCLFIIEAVANPHFQCVHIVQPHVFKIGQRLCYWTIISTTQVRKTIKFRERLAFPFMNNKSQSWQPIMLFRFNKMLYYFYSIPCTFPSSKCSHPSDKPDK